MRGCAVIALATACLPTAWSQAVVAPGFASESKTYLCAGGARVPVVYLNIEGGNSFVAIHVDGTLVLLRSAPAGSGARYVSVDEQQGYRWHVKGDEGMLLHLPADHTAHETVLLRDCKPTRAR